ncbi:MAG TPA: DNA-binding response regulator [Myxococcota bacterium]|nr:DNA-binding response regulator [Myxococcota bacterium]
MFPQPERVLIVEDHKPLRTAITRAARGWGSEVLEAGTVRDGLALLAKLPDVVIVDVALPDGQALPIVEEAVQIRPAAAVVAMSGQASAEEAFRLARAGARRYLAKPISLEELTRSVEEAIGDRPKLAAFVAAHVGNTPLREVQSEVRRVMIEQALAKARNSRSGAARLLDLTRQAVQQIVRELDAGRRGGREPD